MLTEYNIHLTKRDAAAILPYWDFLASRLNDNSPAYEVMCNFATFWRNRLAYAYRLPIKSVYFEIRARDWAMIDAITDTIESGKWYHIIDGTAYRLKLGADWRELIRTIRWEIDRININSRIELRPQHYKKLLNPANHGL